MTEKAIGLAELSLFVFCNHNDGGLMRRRVVFGRVVGRVDG